VNDRHPSYEGRNADSVGEDQPASASVSKTPAAGGRRCASATSFRRDPRINYPEVVSAEYNPEGLKQSLVEHMAWLAGRELWQANRAWRSEYEKDFSDSPIGKWDRARNKRVYRS
jgi:hypothetical protein